MAGNPVKTIMNPFQRVALINVRIESRQRIPIGLLTLAACIKDMARTVIFDPDLDENSLADVIAFNPDLIGMGFMTQTRFRVMSRRLLKLRDGFQSSPIQSDWAKQKKGNRHGHRSYQSGIGRASRT